MLKKLLLVLLLISSVPFAGELALPQHAVVAERGDTVIGTWWNLHHIGFEAVGIDSVVHFLRTRDYSVVHTKDDRYDLDGRKVLTAQELFERANGVRAQLGRPIWAELENMPQISDAQKAKI